MDYHWHLKGTTPTLANLTSNCMHKVSNPTLPTIKAVGFIIKKSEKAVALKRKVCFIKSADYLKKGLK